MPKEFSQLEGKPLIFEKCPKCKSSLQIFQRGLVQSSIRKFLGMKYCAVICRYCKEIIGWEKP